MTGHHNQIDVKPLSKAKDYWNSITPSYFGLGWHSLGVTLINDTFKIVQRTLLGQIKNRPHCCWEKQTCYRLISCECRQCWYNQHKIHLCTKGAGQCHGSKERRFV